MAKTDKDIPKMAICKPPKKEFNLKGAAKFVTEYIKENSEHLDNIDQIECVKIVNEAFEAWERENE